MKVNTDLTAIFNKYKGFWVALDETLKKGYQKPTLFKVPQKIFPTSDLLNEA